MKPKWSHIGVHDLRNLPPTSTPPPITSNSVTNFARSAIQRDASHTRIVVHARFPLLVTQFLAHKRLRGSRVERSLYHARWTCTDQIARLVAKRALAFLGSGDYTVLRDGAEIGVARQEWDRVGTDDERKLNRHLFLKDYLSYDEIMLSSLLGVSGPSFFINDGRRENMGHVARQGDFEDRGVIVGLVGARFERRDRMDAVFMLRGEREPRQDPELTELFCEFFGRKRCPELDFDAAMYKARIRVTAEILLFEASRRARDAGKKAHVYIVGLGLGVWAKDPSQLRLYVEAFLESVTALGEGPFDIATLEFAYIEPVLGFKSRRIVHDSSKAVIDVRFTKRNPAAKLRGEDADRLLVLSYAWDGNSMPGNEYWMGSLAATGDPAAACMSTIGELHNPMINPGLLERIEVLDKPPRASSERSSKRLSGHHP
ncbi:hypothetical protein F4808DRAFT_452497 [Astrocystis sublimbata]|nr:hypothetical protein F4808DRAFT_452497 [Astrocystis sublimbata]